MQYLFFGCLSTLQKLDACQHCRRMMGPRRRGSGNALVEASKAVCTRSIPAKTVSAALAIEMASLTGETYESGAVGRPPAEITAREPANSRAWSCGLRART